MTITPKADVPKVEKKVKETNDSTGVTSDWQDGAGYDIGDTISFQLTGTVANNYDDYETYKFVFHDKESAGLTFQEVTSVKVGDEVIQTGYIADVPSCGGTRVKIPECLRLELEDYVSSQGVQTGPVFVTRNGQNMSRTSVTDCIQRLATAAHIDPGKGNPRCLCKLYLVTREQIRLSLMPLAEQAHEQMIDAEQFAIGWKKKKSS